MTTAAADSIRIRFRGVRGSHPMPGPGTFRYGGNTSCQEIHAGGRLLVLDAGTGIISLGRDLEKHPPVPETALFFSHYHHDHIDGLLYFKPAYDAAASVHIFGPADGAGSDMLPAFERVSCPAAHPVPFARMGMRYTTTVLGDGDAVVWRPGAPAPELLAPGAAPGADDVVVKARKNPLHPLDGVLHFRLEHKGRSYVYATDVEGDEEKGDNTLAAFARGADLLAHDGQYESGDYFANRRGWGHSTVAMAVRTARMAEVRQLAVIHHDPSSDDAQLDAMEKEAREDFPNLFFAREDQEVTL